MVTHHKIATAPLPNDSAIDSLVEDEEIRGVHIWPQTIDARGIGLTFLFDIDEDPFQSEREGEVQKIEGIGVICQRFDTRVVGQGIGQGPL